MAMQASAADVRSILSIPSTGSGSQPLQRKASAASTKKPEGISRELYSLIGNSTPLLAAQLAKPRFKQKPNLNVGGKVKWEWRTFKNSARTDSLELSHWVKASSDPDAEYPFAKYNVQATNYTYTDDEYSRLLNEDPEWTKEETDYLFKIIYDYDLRWFIIYDRYEYPNSTRTLEDLKDRFYGVCRKLVRNRPWLGDQASQNTLLSTLSFDKERELSRKKYIQSLRNRTPEQIAEEEALFIEIKRLEQTERRFKRERDELLRKIAGIDSGLPEVIEDDHGLSLTIDTKRRKRPGLDDSPTPSLPPSLKRPQNPKSAAYDAQHYIIRTEPSGTTPATKAAHTPAYLRTFKLPSPKAAIAPKVTQALSELSISNTRLVMPTRDNVAQLEALVEATIALLDIKKAVDKVDYDINVAKSRLGLKNDKDDAMDVDEGGDGDRAQSVMSIRSRGRRSQRSMSVSSVDTTATGRIKRQKRS